MRLKDKVAIITGAGGGMGLNMVKRFMNEGAQIVAVDLSIKEVDDLLNQQPGRHASFTVDITREDQVRGLISSVINQYGQIDILVNLAGIAQPATPIEEVSRDTWQKIMDVNVTSSFLLSQAVVPFMKKNEQGVILNISSIAAVRPRPGLNAYIASKGALLALTQALAIELAPNHIRVNAINPGPADTKMLAEFAAEGTDKHTVKKDIFASSVPLGRLINPDDITHAAVYLCSDESEIVTGSIFNIDGGRGL
jgi:3-oxoacyl-[acyl-carrier protein] reductase